MDTVKISTKADLLTVSAFMTSLTTSSISFSQYPTIFSNLVIHLLTYHKTRFPSLKVHRSLICLVCLLLTNLTARSTSSFLTSLEIMLTYTPFVLSTTKMKISVLMIIRYVHRSFSCLCDVDQVPVNSLHCSSELQKSPYWFELSETLYQISTTLKISPLKKHKDQKQMKEDINLFLLPNGHRAIEIELRFFFRLLQLT